MNPNKKCNCFQKESRHPCWFKYHHRNYICGAVYLWDGLEHGHKLQGGHGDDPPDLKCGTLMHIAAPDFHKYCSEFTKTPPQAKNLFFFLGRGQTPSRSTPVLHQPSLLDSPLHSREFQPELCLWVVMVITSITTSPFNATLC